MPVRLTVTGDTPEFCAIESKPLRAPADVGANVTLIVHEALISSCAGQLFDCEKSVDDVMLEIARGA